MKKLIYSKHTPLAHCGVAYFSAILTKYLSGQLIHSFHGYSRCDELFINMDILELNESEASSLLNFMSSGNAGKIYLIMHDYRFSYLEDEMVKKADIVVNLSGEPALAQISKNKMIELATPSFTEKPVLKFTKKSERPLSLTFGFFSPRKKSYKMYVGFYEYMLSHYPDWYHILVASTHTGHENSDKENLARNFNSDSVLVLDFLPNQILSELISASDLGVFFYPTGFMSNNAAPMSFFAQGKTIVTTYGALTPPDLKKFTLNGTDLSRLNFTKMDHFTKLGSMANSYYRKNLSWEIFVGKIYAYSAK